MQGEAFGVITRNDIPDNIRKKESITGFSADFREHNLNISQNPNTTSWRSCNFYHLFSFFSYFQKNIVIYIISN